MHEFEIIESIFRPLTRGFEGALDLTDDAALVSVPPGHELVVTKDAISQGVHFIGDEDPALIAQKLLRVNLSDLAAMGATPLCYLLALFLPDGDETWLRRFAEGLRIDQETFRIHLAGGDTVSTKGTPGFSLTVLGTIPAGKALRRNAAQKGDIIYVSGTLGDSALGLAALQAGTNEPFLIDRYLLPQPRVTLGQTLLGSAHACMDISDGLTQDLGHICKASNVGATLYRDKLPLSPAAKKHPQALDAALSGGDDYELLFTAPADQTSAIGLLAAELQLPLTAIGEITEGNMVKLVDENGKPLEIKHEGFQHF